MSEPKETLADLTCPRHLPLLAPSIRTATVTSPIANCERSRHRLMTLHLRTLLS